MNVEVLYTRGCPGFERTLALVREVMREEDVEAGVELCRVETPEEAAARRFPGSPTIRVNGQDIDAASATAVGLCCRTYIQSDGAVAPVPPREAIEAAVRAALARRAENAPVSGVTPLPLGGPAPDFSLPGTDGRTYTLASFADCPYLVVAFLANHCPYAAAWENRLVALARRYARKGVAVAAICSSDIDRFPADRPEHMAERVQDRRFPFPYLYDAEQYVARAFGATHTPHVFLFGPERRLRYRGAIDSDWENRPGMVPHLRNALDALLAGQIILQPVTPPRGTRIRYRGERPAAPPR